MRENFEHVKNGTEAKFLSSFLGKNKDSETPPNDEEKEKSNDETK
jgi:hypothetical protein